MMQKQQDSLVELAKELDIFNENEENDFMCPISHQIMSDPVIIEDGSTYERSSIEKWFRRNPGNYTSPKTNLQLSSNKLISNTSLKKAIQYFKRINQKVRKFKDARRKIVNQENKFDSIDKNLQIQPDTVYFCEVDVLFKKMPDNNHFYQRRALYFTTQTKLLSTNTRYYQIVILNKINFFYLKFKKQFGHIKQKAKVIDTVRWIQSELKQWGLYQNKYCKDNKQFIKKDNEAKLLEFQLTSEQCVDLTSYEKKNPTRSKKAIMQREKELSK